MFFSGVLRGDFPLMLLAISGISGTSLAAYKLFYVQVPEEIKNVRLPLKAKEMVMKCMYTDSLNEKIRYLQVASDLCGKRYGFVSEEYTALLALKAKYIGDHGDCEEMAVFIPQLINKAHVGEAVSEEVTRLTAAMKLLQACKNCAKSSSESVNEAILKCPQYVREKIFNKSL